MSDSPESQEFDEAARADIEASNLVVARKMLNAFNTGRTEVVAECVHPSLRSHSPRQPGTESVEYEIELQQTAFDDINFRESVSIGDGDMVFLGWVATGTHTGELLGKPASGNRFELHGGEIMRLRDNLIVEHWDHFVKPRLESLILIDALDDDMMTALRNGGML